MHGNAPRWTLSDGVTLTRAPIGAKDGLALQIARHALATGQLRRVLERRFIHAPAFKDLFIYMDTAHTLVIWQGLPAQQDAIALNARISAALSLADLERLDDYRTYY
ncbi:transcriptional regulator [Pseudomonas sp. 15FMM2]|uniref:Transcriptional regulator n=1 Tax=Pseudomonas imrae TaxID=2992837 RepID=A0ACC7P795_9PSED